MAYLCYDYGITIASTIIAAIATTILIVITVMTSTMLVSTLIAMITKPLLQCCCSWCNDHVAAIHLADLFVVLLSLL